MKIMVTGAGGFVGSRLAAYYGKKYDVWGVTHKDLDLTDEAAVFKTVENYRPDVLLHCAAVSDVAECSKKPELSHAVNVLGTEYLAKACGKTGTKLVMCSSDQVYFRKRGEQESLDAYKDELEYLKTTRADEVAEQLKEARSFGDLSENAEYDAAKDKQAQNAARIAEIQAILANAQVAATTGDLTVSIGSTVSLIDPNGEVMEVTLVGTTETNSLEHKISNESPLGKALIGAKVGDKVSVEAPAGMMEYKVLKIERNI